MVDVMEAAAAALVRVVVDLAPVVALEAPDSPRSRSPLHPLLLS